MLEKGYADPDQLSPSELRRFQNYIELFYVIWERAYSTFDTGVLSQGTVEVWNTWFISVAERDPAFVWPMVRDPQDWNPDFIRHVDQALGYPKPGVDPE